MFTILAQPKYVNFFAMNKQNLLVAVFFTLLFLSLSGLHVSYQSEEELLIACQKKLENKPCIPKEQEVPPKQLRPSAMVKLASYTPEQR